MTHVQEYAVRPMSRPGMPACGGATAHGHDNILGPYDDKSRVDCPACRALLNVPATALPGSKG